MHDELCDGVGTVDARSCCCWAWNVPGCSPVGFGCICPPSRELIPYTAQPSRSSSRFCGPRLPPLAWTIHTVRCSLIILECSPLISLSFSQVKAFNQFSLQALANLNTLNSSSIRHTWPLLVHCEDRQSILLCGNLFYFIPISHVFISIK